MGGLIFVRRSEGPMVELRRSGFEREVDLQQLLADHPDLLGGDEMRGEQFRRWLYIASEVGVPDEEEGAGRWGADLVFVDQDGVPAIVEVKRRGDTRLRREVIGQLLDYAAHAETYWQDGYLYEHFVERCRDEGKDPHQVLTEFLDGDSDLDQFWEQVHTNLQAGHISIVLAADDIPPETRRVLEFLNEQMSPAEVFGLQVGHFRGEVDGEALQALVPQIIGITEASQVRRRAARTYEAWSITDAQNAVSESCDDCVGEALEVVWQWADDRGLVLEAGSGAAAAIMLRYPRGDELIRMFNITSSYGGQVSLGPRPGPFDSEELRQQLADQLNAIDGFEIDDSNIRTGWPVFALDRLCDERVLASYLDVWDWFIDQYRRHDEDQGDDVGPDSR